MASDRRRENEGGNDRQGTRSRQGESIEQIAGDCAATVQVPEYCQGGLRPIMCGAALTSEQTSDRSVTDPTGAAVHAG